MPKNRSATATRKTQRTSSEGGARTRRHRHAADRSAGSRRLSRGRPARAPRYGQTLSHLLRHRPPPPRPRHLGISRHRAPLGRNRLRPAARAPHSQSPSPWPSLVTLIGIPAATRVARASGGKDPAIRRHRRSRRTTHRAHRRPARMENFPRGFYTFSESSTSSSRLRCGNWRSFRKAPESCSTMSPQEFTRWS